MRIPARELQQAARIGDLPTVKALLDEGVPPDATPSGKGITALMHAVKEGHVPVVRLLLEHRADPNHPNALRVFHGVIEIAKTRELVLLLRAYGAVGSPGVPDNPCLDCGSDITFLGRPIPQVHVSPPSGFARLGGKCENCGSLYFFTWNKGELSPWRRDG